MSHILDSFSEEEYERKIGRVIENMKSIEYFIDCIIINRINPTDLGFMQNVLLNSGIIPVGSKIKILKTICKEKGIKDDFKKLHRLISIRNLFAHETPYVEGKDMIIKMNELRGSDGKYIESEFEKVYEESLKLFNEEQQKLVKLFKI